MTTATSDVVSHLKCTVCHEQYRGRNPKILPCYHTFCATCLERLVRTPHIENNGRHIQSDKDLSKLAIICPTCRKVIPVPIGGVMSFLSNSYLDEIGWETNDSQPPCDFCEGGHTAKDTCKECKSKFCVQCREIHDMICPEREVIPLCSKPLETLQTINNGCLGIESVREQIEVLEAVLSRLDEEEVEVEHQKQAIESDIKARYDAGISTLMEAHDVCWNSLTAAVQRTRDRLQKERSDVHRAHEKLTNLAQDTSLTSVDDPKSDAHATLLDGTELSRFKERTSKTRQPLFFAYTSCRASVPHILNFFRDYMGHISSPECLPSVKLTHTESGRKSPIQATRAEDFSCVSEAELSNHEAAISKVLLARARESSESKIYLSNLTDRVELLTNQVDLLMNKLQLGQIGIPPVINNPQWRMPHPFINPGFDPLIASLLAGASLQNQIHVRPIQKTGGPPQMPPPQMGPRGFPSAAQSNVHLVSNTRPITNIPVAVNEGAPAGPCVPKEPAGVAHQTGTAKTTNRKTNRYMNTVKQIRNVMKGAQRQAMVNPGQEPLTEIMLATAPPPQQKLMVGERLYPLIKCMYPELADKIMGVLLKTDCSELFRMLVSQALLKVKVEEAVAVLQTPQTTEATVAVLQTRQATEAAADVAAAAKKE